MGNPTAKAKHRFFAKWRHTALSVGFLTLVYVASALAQGSEYIYWTENRSPGQIGRVNLDGTDIQNLTPVTSGRGIALDLTNNHIYCCEKVTTSHIGLANMDGTNKQ